MIAARVTPEPAALQTTFPPSEETELPSMLRVMQRPDFAGQAPNTSADAVPSVAQSPNSRAAARGPIRSCQDHSLGDPQRWGVRDHYHPPRP